MSNMRDTEEDDVWLALLSIGDIAKIEKYGFVIHYVPNDDFDHSPSGVNIHTHGLHKINNHLDFQITVPLPPHIASRIMHRLYELVKGGEVFCAGGESDKVLQGGMKVGFIEVQECDRTVLRVIIPDEDGNHKQSTMNRQWRTAQFGQQRTAAGTPTDAEILN